MYEIVTSQAFGIMLTLLFYIIGTYLYNKTKITYLNPLLIATILLILFIKIAKIDLNTFLTDLSGINVFLGPLIVSLAVPIIKRIDLIKKNIVPIIVGAFFGSLASMLSVIVLGKWFGLDQELIASIIPKSATTPIAIEVTNKLGGIRAITVAVVIISSIIGTILIPLLIKILRIKDPKIVGMGLGITSHAVGTSKAIEIHQTAGAIAGVALVFSGIATAIIAMFL
ncbi:MAG TPA: LrgB family protein [Acholeplasmataceae bacterium]|nr:LrgB family protein [Acholeplasmataceae bacterium]